MNNYEMHQKSIGYLFNDNQKGIGYLFNDNRDTDRIYYDFLFGLDFIFFLC